MNNTSPKENTSNQEIDLAFLFNSLKNLVDNIGFTLFRIFNFYLRNIIVTIILTLVGIGFGYYQYTNNTKAYKHEVIVIPNFKSSTYLYNKIKELKKTKPNSVFSHVNSVTVKPVIDVYQFVTDNKQNLDIARYMSENTIEVTKFKEDSDVEKLYKYHILSYYTDIPDTDLKIYKAIIDELNNDEYLNARKNIEVVETKNKLVEYQNSVEKINNIFTYLGGGVNQSTDVNISMYSQINDLMLTKNDLLNTINKTKIELIEQEKVIYDASKSLNLSNKSFIKIFLYPILLNFIFIVIAWIVKQYRRYKLRYSTI